MNDSVKHEKRPVRITKSSVVKKVFGVVFLVPGALILLMGLIMIFSPTPGPEAGMESSFGILFALIALPACGIGAALLRFGSVTRCGWCDERIRKRAEVCPSCGVTFVE